VLHDDRLGRWIAKFEECAGAVEEWLAGGMHKQSLTDQRIEATMKPLASMIEGGGGENDDASALGSERGAAIREGGNTHCAGPLLWEDRAVTCAQWPARLRTPQSMPIDECCVSNDADPRKPSAGRFVSGGPLLGVSGTQHFQQ
jgi:hypothetical protein